MSNDEQPSTGTDSEIRLAELDDDLRELVQGVLDGEQLALSRLITRIENGAPGNQDAIKVLYRHTDGVRTVGITGQPGAGKSTLVDKLVDIYRERGLSVGVIAVDPSSPYTGGSVLGDRIRQTTRNDDPEVFFRSMSARGHVGGLAAATFDVIHAMDAFEKDIVIVETVGAGQNEVEVVRAADTVCVVMLPGAGDDVQANKAGILEIADVFAINKADLDDAKTTAHEIQQMIRIGQDLDRTEERESEGWIPKVESTIATQGEGVRDLVDAFDGHYEYLRTHGELPRKRGARFEQEVQTHVDTEFDELRRRLIAANPDLLEAGLDPYTATEKLVYPVREAVDELLTSETQ